MSNQADTKVLGVNVTVYLPVNVLAQADMPAQPSQYAAPGTPLGDPRSHPGTRVAGEGIITAGRGQAPNAWTSAGMQKTR